MNKPRVRCINLDWLEVYALEPIDQPHTPDYYRSFGVWVEQREYGTRIYNEMFHILDQHGNKVLEVRRNPKQSGVVNSILPPNACHIRLSNRMCYSPDAVNIMKNFLKAYGLTFVRIFRVDICLDFERFDSGDEPKKFLHRYVQGKFAKINQSEAHGHFNDRWDTRDWSSISWGSKKSAISTKMYLKTKELKERGDKPYIRWAWFSSGLVDDPQALTRKDADGNTYTPDIWRVEFSIQSNVKNWLTYEFEGKSKTLRSVRNTLDMYDTPEKLLSMFMLLQQHYFHFRHFVRDKSKYDCPQKVLFYFNPQDQILRVEHLASADKASTLHTRLLKLLNQYSVLYPTTELLPAIRKIIDALKAYDLRRLAEDPYSHAQLIALQQIIAARLEGKPVDPQTIIQSVLHYFESPDHPY